MDASAVQAEFRSLEDSILIDMNGHQFVQITPMLLSHFGNKTAFGYPVAKSFPDAMRDAEEAGNCMAVGSDTNLHPGIGYINLTYTFQGRPTDLLIASGSLDGARTYVFEVRPAFTATSMAKNICYWNTGDGMDTMLTIWNHGLKDEDLLFTFNHAQGSYKHPIHLKPQASQMLSIHDLIARSKPDADGNILPRNVEEGSAMLSGIKDEIQPIDATISVASFDVNHATCIWRCINCSGYVMGFTFTNLPFSIQPNQSIQVNSIATYSGGHQYDFTSKSDWSSDLPGVATVGTGNSSPGLAHGISAGTTTISAISSVLYPIAEQICGTTPQCGYDNMDYISGNGLATVTPATPINFQASAPSLSSDGTLTFTYTFQSSTGNLSDLSACKVGETVFYPGSTNPYVWPYPMRASTANPTVILGPATSGGFTDMNKPPSSYTKPYSASSFSATQTLQWECSNYNNGQFNKFVPDITITRSVFLNTVWKYQITKSGAVNTVNLP